MPYTRRDNFLSLLCRHLGYKNPTRALFWRALFLSRLELERAKMCRVMAGGRAAGTRILEWLRKIFLYTLAY
jgi:hypothetical protein